MALVIGLACSIALSYDKAIEHARPITKATKCDNNRWPSRKVINTVHARSLPALSTIVHHNMTLQVQYLFLGSFREFH